jgi:hypothetical protein
MIISIRNKLVYPAGFAPGFNPSHPCAGPMAQFSVVACHSQWAMRELTRNLPLTLVGSGAPSLPIPPSDIGPVVNWDNGTNNSGQTIRVPHTITTNENAFTCGTIFTLSSLSGFGSVLYCGDSGASGWQVEITNSSSGSGMVDNGITVRKASGYLAFSQPSFVVNLNTPYFLACTATNVVAGVVRIVLVDLKTGVTKTHEYTGDFSAYGTGAFSTAYSAIGCNEGGMTVSHHGTIAAQAVSMKLSSMSDLRVWAEDPWAFWYPDLNMFSSEVGVIVVLVPDSDTSTGGWANSTGGSTLYSSVDELVVDDADYIRSSTNPVNNTCSFSLSNPPYGITTPFHVTYRYKAIGTGDVDLWVRLMEGATEIASWSHPSVDTNFVTVTQTLTDPQFASITDPSNLSIQIRANKP